MNIRTHTTTVDSFGGLDDMGPGWEPGTPVLVVAGLPDRCDLRPLCQVPEGWEWQGAYGTWIEANQKVDTAAIGVMLCRPVPVPAPPATEDVDARAADVIETWAASLGAGGAAQVAKRLRMAGLLVDPAPTGDDERVTFVGPDRAQQAVDWLTGDDEPQADTPAPQGRWTVDPDGDPLYVDGNGHEAMCIERQLPGRPNARRAEAVDALVDLVRRDGTAPTPDLTPLFDALDAHTAQRPNGDRFWTTLRHLLAAVRALRDGGTR